jgi:hypothetical protein
METTANIENVAELVNNLPAMVLHTFKSLVSIMATNHFQPVGPLTKYPDGKRFAPDTNKKQAVISRYRHLKQIYSTTLAEQASVQ